MLASTRPNQGKRERRGIILVLVLGMLALMALIGITFATFSGQSRISARNFFQSMNQPQRDELMDYALSQLISDTPDRQSAIRGHSMARDMYGNDANFNGYLTSRPDGQYRAPNNDPYFYIMAVTGRDRHPVQPDDQHPLERPDVLRLQLHPLDDAGHVPRHLTGGGTGVSTRPSRSWPTASPAAIPGIHGQHRPHRRAIDVSTATRPTESPASVPPRL